MRIDHAKIKNGKKTYLWVYRNRSLRGTHPIVLFDWQPSRHSDHLREFLKTFSGTVITKIIHIDNTFEDLSVTDHKKPRQFVLSKKVDAYFAQTKQKYLQVTHNSTIGKALAYNINQEEYLRVFLSDGNVPMDNNYAEQAIRPFTIGRKNFARIESSNGAKASAILYSLVETAKVNMINTSEYFNLLLTEIPQHIDNKDLRFIDDLFHGHPESRKNVPVDTKSLNFSMCLSIL